MKKTTIEYSCDICTSKENVKAELDIPVVFTTEQTEGRSCPHYLKFYKLDVCLKCYGIVLSGKIPFGSGAMGHNTYSFKG
jgi:hypothetical protein